VDELAAFDRAFASHEADVARVCSRLLGTREDARDASHEIFLRARRSLPTYDPARPLRPWLLRIAGNYCIDLLRRRAHEQRVFAQLDPEDVAPLETSPAHDGISPLSRVLALEQREALARAIGELPLQYRLPLVLRYFSELDYAAIGEALDLPPGQVGSLLFRAKRMLRDAVGEPAAARRRRRSRR
jgi:RNA polymerase sigma-70 factor (ECF subfamily)